MHRQIRGLRQVRGPRTDEGDHGRPPGPASVRRNGSTPVAGQVDLVEALGAETLIYVSTPNGAQFVARQNERTGLHAGDAVSLEIDASQAHWFDTAGRVVAARAA